MQEAAEKTGREIIASEIRLTEEFKKKGNNVIMVDKNAFREAVLKNTKPTDQGYRQPDYDRILNHQVIARLPPTRGSQRPPERNRQMQALDDLPKVMGDDGQFHAQDEVVDLSGTTVEAWVALGFFWMLGLTVFYQFVTRYVMNDSAAWTEEIARYLLIGTVFIGATIGVAKNNHIQVDFFYRHMPAAMGALAGHGWSTCCASSSSAPPWC